MLSPEYLKAIPNELIKVYQEIEDEILLDIARRIARKDEAGYTSTYQLKQLLIGNKDFEELKKKLKPMLYHSDEVLDEIIENGIKTHYNDEQSIYSMVGKSLVNLDKNKAVLSQIQAYKKAMKENLNNLTKTMGVAVNDDFVNLNTLYKHELNKAVLSTQLGVLDSTTAIRRVVNNIARGGVKFINYEGSGRNYTIESAVGMVVRSGLNRLSGEISLLNAEEMEQDLMEISAHLGARPSHSVWQGEIVSLSGRSGYLDLQDIGYGETTGFQGVNCRHNWYPYFEGLSYRSYSKEYLQELEDKKVYYEGEEYTYYEATQIQRQLERDVRNLKKRVMMYDTVGDKEMHAIQSFKLKNKRDEYYKFSESIGINKRLENLGKFGYTKSVSGRSVWARKQYEEVKSGAITDISSKKAIKHAKTRYEFIRNNKYDVEKIAKNTGYSIEQIQSIKDYLFVDEHDLGDKRKRFDPSFAISQSWDRLTTGKFEPHDLTLIKHEIMEKDLIKQGYTQDKAHKITSQKYNYQKEMKEYYVILKERKKRG